MYYIEVWDVWESWRHPIMGYDGILKFDTDKEAKEYADSHLNGDRYPRNQREIKKA